MMHPTSTSTSLRLWWRVAAVTATATAVVWGTDWDTVVFCTGTCTALAASSSWVARPLRFHSCFVGVPRPERRKWHTTGTSTGSTFLDRASSPSSLLLRPLQTREQTGASRQGLESIILRSTLDPKPQPPPTTGIRPVSTITTNGQEQERRDESVSRVLTMYNSKTRRKEIFVPQRSPKHTGSDDNMYDKMDDNNNVNNQNDNENELLLTAENHCKSSTPVPIPVAAAVAVVTMYTCGPTVYDSAHIGNFRAFLTYDILKRVLLYILGYTVVHVCNITDIDDKIIQRAHDQKLPLGTIQTALTQRYENIFLQDLSSLNCVPATVYPRATQHVPAMIRMVQTLASKGLAYSTLDGSWYFDTQNDKLNGRYGQQLVQLDYTDMQQQKGTVENAGGKRHFADFCLWKAFKNDDNSNNGGGDREDAAWSSDMFYVGATSNADTQIDQEGEATERVDNLYTVDYLPEASGETSNSDNDIAPTSPDRMEQLRQAQLRPLASLPEIGKGRPGWHLECSAMAQTYFGNSVPLDFHGGGVDLKFPHHENEIAQSEGITVGSYPMNKDAIPDNHSDFVPFCSCWFHNGFVNIGSKNEKMSKSLGNFMTLSDACPTPLDIRAYRYLIASSQYRNPLSFTDDIMEASKNAVLRLDKVKLSIENTLANRVLSTVDAANVSELATVVVPEALDAFDEAVRDDLSMPRAAAALFAVVKAAEKELKIVESSPQDVDTIGLQAVLDAMLRMDLIFGIFYKVPGSDDDSRSDGDVGTNLENNPLSPPVDVMVLVDQRNAAKNLKDWALADSLRQRITELGWAVKDVKGGGDPILTRIGDSAAIVSNL